MQNQAPLPLAITMGCPSSIGPEIILKNFLHKTEQRANIVLGDIGILKKAAQELGLNVPITAWQPGEQIEQQSLLVMPLSNIKKHIWGAPDHASGTAMASYITKAVEMTQAGIFSGIVTCPISKASLNQAGFHFPGHTEMLASLTSTEKVGMMMAGDRLRVTLVTLHCPLATVAAQLSVPRVLEMIRITHTSLQDDLGFKMPRIGVAALNPHAGEGGLFGNEEATTLMPAIEQARAEGIKVSEPLPPDTVFVKAIAGEFDAVVCMYHDQGLIPFKLIHFEDGVNVTLGLPIVRTSVDHGTAYDIAGRGIASHSSLAAAIELAEQITIHRQQNL
ncbi:4-hydroxythreonine-4-phosphate dehydrogenase PdxA [Desulfotalea psychrophila]|uniref:4-hydroxythreonine-4-phosphate dehydrogenase n=1 Tax=Desulfotalea psychrophila (strain LSv54 / DSM 12343) TaxID=177439 RepID=Q6AJE3_DESPS|nr:4-hydroxythreonine-4-phosphate dehydrogenase PdxA [Desulfotalea psychrophila]CAG37537.1 related to 4-hydroxythreonine-4-phosphate dehydrogenase (PdxA) [Desulfotalea psychrophila LSv54]